MEVEVYIVTHLPGKYTPPIGWVQVDGWKLANKIILEPHLRLALCV